MPSEDLTFAALDGRPLAATIVTPDAPPRGALVVLGALGVRRRFYAPFAAWLARHGVATWTFDYRGCGDSRSVPLRQDPATLLDWARLDAAAAIDRARERWGSVWGLGHSFGGQAIGLTPRGLDLAGAIVMAAGSGDMSLYPARLRRSYEFRLRVLVPAISTVFGYVPGRLGVGEDLPAGVLRQWARWCLTPDYARGALGEGATYFHRLAAPMRFYDFTDDDLAPAAAAAALRGWYGRAAITHRTIAPAELGAPRIGHFGGFRPGPAEAVWADIAAAVGGVRPVPAAREDVRTGDSPLSPPRL